MARKFARLYVNIWSDPDFVALHTDEQVVYLGLISSADISWCGVNPLLPQRFAGLAANLTEHKARRAFATLQETRFVIVDTDTAEIAARTFIRHDEVMRQPNIAKAMGRALGLVRSDRIREAILDELGREFATDPGLRGWASLQAAYPDIYDKAVAKASGNPSRKGSRKPSDNPNGKG